MRGSEGDLYLHVGGHRTGSSSLQLALSLNAPRLAEHGFDVAYPSRDGAAGGRLRLRLLKRLGNGEEPGANVARIRAHLRDHIASDARSLIVSDENILGAVAELAEGRFYAATRRRCRVLGEALWCRPKRVVLVVRNYAELFPSAYRFQAALAPVRPWAEIADALAQFKGGWLRSVHHIRTFLDPEDLVVIDYRKRGQSVGLLSRLATVSGLVEPERRINLSATDAALKVIQEHFSQGKALQRDALQDLVAKHAVDRSDMGVVTVTPALQTALDARYRADLDALDAQGDVTLVR